MSRKALPRAGLVTAAVAGGLAIGRAPPPWDDRPRDEGQGHEDDTAHSDPAMRRQVAPDEDHESETREEHVCRDGPSPQG